jgi:hypothetical protein
MGSPSVTTSKDRERLCRIGSGPDDCADCLMVFSGLESAGGIGQLRAGRVRAVLFEFKQRILIGPEKWNIRV